MFGIIYIITNSVNSKVYIGQTIQTLKARWQEHCRVALYGSESKMAIKRAIFKYGSDKFTIKELEKCDISKLDEREIYYIEFYNSYNNGYNSTKGGKSGTKPLKLSSIEQDICTELYTSGFSLRNIANEYNVDKATIKHILEINNIKLRSSRTYKLSSANRKQIIEESTYLSRKEIMNKWKISKGYLSELLNGKRRI